jgi:hypothetical protein
MIRFLWWIERLELHRNPNLRLPWRLYFRIQCLANRMRLYLLRRT